MRLLSSVEADDALEPLRSSFSCSMAPWFFREGILFIGVGLKNKLFRISGLFHFILLDSGAKSSDAISK
jgi:hypothetical protein